MDMNNTVILEWTFSPDDYFDEELNVSDNHYKMFIRRGEAKVEIDSIFYDADCDMQRQLHDSVRARFLGVQLLTHRSFYLSKPEIERVYPDGRRVRTVTGSLNLKWSIKDSTTLDVNVKRERINKLGRLIAKYGSTDSLLVSLLRSHEQAVRDPGDELVHLYEIRDALAHHFRPDKERSVTGVSTTQWSRFGQLCNQVPLTQGRHRGKQGNALRKATADELNEAREIARTMIEGYLDYLERQNS